MWPFTRGSALERNLRNVYTDVFAGCGLPHAEARKTARELVGLAKKQARPDPDLPPNTGDRLIQREATDPSARQMLADKRREGVTDADLKWWWGLNKLERRLLILVDDWSRLAALKKYRVEGLSELAAISHIRMSFPIYGDPGDAKGVVGDDRPLPFELKERVNRWIERVPGPESLETSPRLRAAGSMNAFIRSEIKAGRL